MIEYSFFLNLGILSSATLFTTLTDGDQTAVVYTSVGIAFTTFMIITIYHILVRVTEEQQRQKFTELIISKLKTVKCIIKKLHRKNTQNNSLQPANHNLWIELREPLLESTNWMEGHQKPSHFSVYNNAFFCYFIANHLT